MSPSISDVVGVRAVDIIIVRAKKIKEYIFSDQPFHDSTVTLRRLSNDDVRKTI